jgi:microcystin-dependent protein
MKWLKKVAATPLTTIARVVDSLQAQTNDRTNAPSIHAVREAVNNNWLSIYPVGSIYMSVNNVNPSTIFGGTWEQIKDKFLLACGDTYNNGATGGEATHTLNANEIPTHNHSYTEATAVEGHKVSLNEMPPHAHGLNLKNLCYHGVGKAAEPKSIIDPTTDLIVDYYVSDEWRTTNITGGNSQDPSEGADAHNHGLTTRTSNTSSAGQGGAHNNMPPYLAVNVWVRTA